MPKLRARRHPLQSGFSYAEVLLAIMLIAILLVPAMQALNSGILGGTNNQAKRQLALRGKMEEVLSKPFDTLVLETPASGNNSYPVSTKYSDDLGTPDRRLVVLYRVNTDASATDANNTGLLYVSVYYAAEGSANALSTLVGRWW